MARARSSVGTVGKRQQGALQGLEELRANIKRLGIKVQLEIVSRAVDDGADEALVLMKQLAPRAPGSGTRGYHGADRLRIFSIFARRDSRARGVGIIRGREGAWFLKFAELGTIFHPETPFIKPTGRAMRKRMVDIIVRHWRRAVRAGIR